jgi:hypothetical protein
MDGVAKLYNSCDECASKTTTITDGEIIGGWQADYLVFRYKFDEGNGDGNQESNPLASGRDLDTRSKLTAPVSGPYIGWCLAGSYSNGSKLYYDWAGDNVGFGYESVIFYLKTIREDYPGIVITGDNAAYWYGWGNTGIVHLEIEAYKDGSMVDNGDFNFIPDPDDPATSVGKITADVTISDDLDLRGTCANTGTYGTTIASWAYDYNTNHFTLTPLGGSTIEVAGESTGGGGSTEGSTETTDTFPPVSPPPVPTVLFSTPQAEGSSNALILYVSEYSGGDDTPSGEYMAELDASGNRTGTWAKLGSDRYGIIASGNLCELVDYTAAEEVLYRMENLANSNPDVANLGVYEKVNGLADRATISDVRP